MKNIDWFRFKKYHRHSAIAATIGLLSAHSHGRLCAESGDSMKQAIFKLRHYPETTKVKISVSLLTIHLSPIRNALLQ